ncbi:hypothetical protein P7C73_g3078, partial [Tremellales sp. Uapishka_1]
MATSSSQSNQVPSEPMPPPPGITRKQNIACDGCRSKKIRCTRSVSTETTKARRTRKADEEDTGRKRRKSKDNEAGAVTPIEPPPTGGETSRAGLERSTSSQASLRRLAPAVLHISPPSAISASSHDPSGSPTTFTLADKQARLLAYLFSPRPVTDHRLEYNDNTSIRLCTQGLSDTYEEDGGIIWHEEPSQAHLSLVEDGIDDFVQDLIETFFSIVHVRITLFSDVDFRSRFAAADNTGLRPLSPALLATVLAWGAKFSEDPIVAQDRRGAEKKSRLVALIVVRARNIAEEERIERIPSMENIHALLLLEGLLGQVPYLGDRYQPRYSTAAIRHLFTLGYTPPNVLGIEDQETRDFAICAWWYACLSDASRSVDYRLKPFIADNDFDTDLFGRFDNMLHVWEPRRKMVDGEPSAWFAASQSSAKFNRELAFAFWTPRVRCHGIPWNVLRDLIHSLSQWRQAHLKTLGVPATWPADWDYHIAICTCTTDMTHHSLWVVLASAVEEFGILEVNKDLVGNVGLEINMVKDRIKHEALYSSLRIAQMVHVLTGNRYLRLDPMLLHQIIYIAGMFLAKMGREECRFCTAGLAQTALAFPQLNIQIKEIDTAYNTTWINNVPLDLNIPNPDSWADQVWQGMGSVAPGSAATTSLFSTPAQAEQMLDPAASQYDEASFGALA